LQIAVAIVTTLELPWVCIKSSRGALLQVCFEFLFDSCVATSVLKCGHTIHSSCLKQLSSAGQTTCPICMRSYGDMTAVSRAHHIESKLQAKALCDSTL
jgi:hypothetical protein